MSEPVDPSLRRSLDLSLHRWAIASSAIAGIAGTIFGTMWGFVLAQYRFDVLQNRVTSVETDFKTFKTERIENLEAFKLEQAHLHSEIDATLAVLKEHIHLDDEMHKKK